MIKRLIRDMDADGLNIHFKNFVMKSFASTTRKMREYQLPQKMRLFFMVESMFIFRWHEMKRDVTLLSKDSKGEVVFTNSIGIFCTIRTSLQCQPAASSVLGLIWVYLYRRDCTCSMVSIYPRCSLFFSFYC